MHNLLYLDYKDLSEFTSWWTSVLKKMNHIHKETTV